MVKFCVFYYGKPEDSAAFDKHYWDHHLPMVTRFPKIKRILISKGQPEEDLYQITELYFDNRTEMEAALGSPERAAAAEDSRRFLKFDGKIIRRTFEVIDFAKEYGIRGETG